MKRFYTDVSTAENENGWQVLLDNRPIKTQKGAAQVVPSAATAALLAGEWSAQGEKIDLSSFVFRDLADFAIDMVRPQRDAAIGKLLSYAETDTLCYRADPGDALYQRQEMLWEPLVVACETRHAIRIQRVSGIIHCQQSEATLAALRERLATEDEFTLAALTTFASIAASLMVVLAMLEHGADVQGLFDAANAEEDWQAELWGVDAEAEKVRAARLDAFVRAAEFQRALAG